DVARPFSLPKQASQPAVAPEARALQDFLRTGPNLLISICELCQAFTHPSEPQFRPLRLKDLHRQVHFFADHAGLAHSHRLAHFAAALEALLFELQERPRNITPSTIQTIEAAVDFLVQLFDRVTKAEEEPVTPTNLLAVLVVDDEPLSNRALVHALSRANVKSASTDSAAAACELLRKNHYDLLLLDYLMPGMDGLELYRELRALPQYQRTPVIFVTSATDFKAAHQDILARGDDVITKPILPIELAVKSLTLLLKRQLAEKK
ncbi:MAG: response regulator, partial [Verrucomicrobia bacterium]|nr:response regulator [Verrucomicrobiota bacterium]